MTEMCKCGYPIVAKDLEIDPTGTWCRYCWQVSQDIINTFEDDENNG